MEMPPSVCDAEGLRGGPWVWPEESAGVSRSLPNRSPRRGGQGRRPEGEAAGRDVVDVWEQGRRTRYLEREQKSKESLLEVKVMLSRTAVSGTC